MAFAKTAQLHNMAKLVMSGLVVEGGTIAHNAAAIISGWYLQGDISQALNNSLADDLQVEDVAGLSPDDKIVYVFKLLRPENSPKNKIVLTDSEFRVFRRAVGNRNYDSAFNILAVVHDTTRNPSQKKALAKAAEILGSVKGATADFSKFKKRFSV